LIFEKSGVSNGSLLGFANGLDAGSVVDSAALRGAAAVAVDVATAIAAVASKRLRIMVLPNVRKSVDYASSTESRLTQV
jgi:hypothetical protein